MNDIDTRRMIRARIEPVEPVTRAELIRTERSPEFDRLRMNRKIIGSLRYGRMGEKGKRKYNRVKDILRRIEAYVRDGNLEHLVDVANLAELEFVEGKNRGQIVDSVDDGPHTDHIPGV